MRRGTFQLVLGLILRSITTEALFLAKAKDGPNNLLCRKHALKRITSAPFWSTLLCLGSTELPIANASGDMMKMETAETENFRFQYPSDWVRTSKLLKTHADEFNVKSEEKRGFYAGVAVDPVKLSSLETFGTPEFVGERVVGVERRKEGVVSADLLSASKEEGENGEMYYNIAYTNESSHGNNHYISRIAIRDEKLFVFTVQSKTRDFEDLSESMLAMAKSFSLQPK